MARAMTVKNLYDKKVKRLVKFTDPHLAEIFGNAELSGCWEFYGIEKNGKTWCILQVAKDLSYNHKTVFISAEEGTDLSFIEAVKRAGINPSHKILFEEYLPIEAIIEKYNKRNAAEILIIDNLTMYSDEMKQFGLINFLEAMPGKLIIFVAHEERREPYPAVAKLAKKLAKVYVHVSGLSGFVVSRFSKGGEIVIDEEGSALYWGDAR